MQIKNKKLLIIGLDGVPYELLKDLTDNGTMPHLKKLLSRGKLQKMEVTIPEISSISWSSFMTGTDPGNHGIFGFVDLYKGKYKYRFPDFRDLKVTTFFDELGKKGKRSIIINLPSTYPAREIPGVLISGFVAPDKKKAVYPPEYIELLENTGYQIDVDVSNGKEKKIDFFSDLNYTLKARKEMADILWKNEKWDIFMFTVTGTDRLHHFMFDAYLDKNNRYHKDFLNYYEELDKVIGNLIAKTDGKNEFEIMILSDHGFGLIEHEVYLNQILRKEGFYKNGSGKLKKLEGITKDSKAFAIDPSRIFINVKEKFPNGSVKPGDYNKVRNDLKSFFEEYRVNGKKVIKKVFFKEELYSKRFLDNSADIILLSNPGFDLKGGLKKDVEFGNSFFTGMHLQDNAFFFSTAVENIPEKINITDIKGSILELFN
ncbi:MAG: alkaline phosphatase family protein [Acidobacteriota bacterium]